MPANWIGQRFKRYQNRLVDENNKKTWEENARASYPSKFQELQDYVEADVAENNKLFPAQLAFSTIEDGFLVTEHPFNRKTGKSVCVMKATAGTVIKIETCKALDDTRHDHIDVVPDESGNVRYAYKGKILSHISEASEAILGSLVMEA